MVQKSEREMRNSAREGVEDAALPLWEGVYEELRKKRHHKRKLRDAVLNRK